VPEGLSLYRLPPWTKLSFTVVDKHTLEVKLWLNAGTYVLPFVLAKAAPLPTISAFQWVASQVSLSFVTTPGYRYTVQKTEALALPAWTEVKHARNPGDPATDDLLDGSGLIETVYVDPPASGLGFCSVRPGVLRRRNSKQSGVVLFIAFGSELPRPVFSARFVRG